MRRLAAFLCIAVSAAIVAGCGNEEQNDYVDQVNALQADLVSEISATVSGSPPSTPGEAADVAGELAGVFAAGADEIAAVEPPEEVADLHDQLVEQVREVSAQIEAAEEAFTSGNAEQASQAAIELQNATNQAQTEFDSIIDQINSELQN